MPTFRAIRFPLLPQEYEADYSTRLRVELATPRLPSGYEKTFRQGQSPVWAEFSYKRAPQLVACGILLSPYQAADKLRYRVGNSAQSRLPHESLSHRRFDHLLYRFAGEVGGHGRERGDHFYR